MGSVLRAGTALTEIWTRDAHRLFGSLVHNQSLLRYSGRPAHAADVLDYMQLVPGVTLTRRAYYTKIINDLGQHPDFKQQNGLLLFPYDWRQDFGAILDQLRDKIRAYNVVFDAKGRAAKHPNLEFYLIGHSMGAVILLLAVARGLIHPDNVGNLILLAPPLEGSAKAFRAFFDYELPFLLEDLWLVWWGKSTDVAWDNLHSAIGTFPSSYQLMPPESEEYAYDFTSSQMINPLRQKLLDLKLVADAKQAHRQIAKAVEQLPLPKDRVHVLYGDAIRTDVHYYVTSSPQVPGGRPAYQLAPPRVVAFKEGDGTVRRRSARYNELLKAHFYPFPNTQHSTFCASQRVLKVLGTLL